MANAQLNSISLLAVLMYADKPVGPDLTVDH
jgi:hypothetical protein